MPAALAALILLGGIDVDGDATCPSPSDVRARLEARGINGPPASVHRVTLFASDAGLLVRLADATGAPLAERTLPASSCASLTEAIAVLLGTWEATLTMPAPAEPAERVEAGKPLETVSAPKPTPSRWIWDVGVSFDAAAGAGGFSFGAVGFASLTFGAKGPGADVWFGALGTHQIPTTAFGLPDDGSLTWQRFPFGLGAHWRLLGDPVHVDVHAEGLVAVLTLKQPPGYLKLMPSVTDDEGFAAGARAEAPLGPILVWFGLSFVYWPGAKTLNLIGGSSAQTLPQFEVLVQQGIALSRG